MHNNKKEKLRTFGNIEKTNPPYDLYDLQYGGNVDPRFSGYIPPESQLGRRLKALHDTPVPDVPASPTMFAAAVVTHNYFYSFNLFQPYIFSESPNHQENSHYPCT